MLTGRNAPTRSAMFVVSALAAVSACGSESQSARLPAAKNAEALPATDCTTTAETYANSFGTVSAVVASYSSDVAAVQAWAAQRADATGTSFYSGSTPVTPVSVCVLDGSFQPPLPHPPGAIVEKVTRIIVLVQAASPQLFQVGTPETVDATGPSPAP